MGHMAVADIGQLGRRRFATVSDSPLAKKVEMTNWEKVHEPSVNVLPK